MSPSWAFGACDAWNASATLSDELYTSGWASNDKDRGHKVLQIYRSDCPDSPRAELRIAAKEGKASCASRPRRARPSASTAASPRPRRSTTTSITSCTPRPRAGRRWVPASTAR
jgi:hypothetical protein